MEANTLAPASEPKVLETFDAVQPFCDEEEDAPRQRYDTKQSWLQQRVPRRSQTASTLLSRAISPGVVARDIQVHLSRVYRSVRKDVEERAQGQAAGSLFKDINDLKDQMGREQTFKHKWSDGFFGKLAGNKVFEAITTLVISLNAIEIGYDADYSARWGKPDSLYQGPTYFIVVENLFCVFFVFELSTRFLGFRRKCYCLIDKWFIFDSMLVTLMLIETYILPFVEGGSSGTGQLGILRLLRLLRITRMARLLRTFPELMLIVKGLAAAGRAVSWTLILLVMLVFVFAILFASIYHQGYRTDEEVNGMVEGSFGSVGKSMYTLLFKGTLLDDVTAPCNSIRRDSRSFMLAPFLVFIVLANFNLLNILVGILVQVVSSTAQSEQKTMKYSKAQEEILAGCIAYAKKSDPYGLSKAVFLKIQHNEKILTPLEEIGMKASHIPAAAEVIYSKEQMAALQPGEVLVINPEQVVEHLFAMEPSKALTLSQYLETEQAIHQQRQHFTSRIGKIARLVKSSDVGTYGNIGSSPDSSANCCPRRASGVRASLLANVLPVNPTGLTSLRRPSHQSSESEDEALKAKPAQPRPSVKRRFKDLEKERSVETQGTSGSRSPLPDQDSFTGKGCRKISLDLIQKLDGTSSAHIVAEITRRMGCEDLGTRGMPLDWFDETTRLSFQGLIASRSSGVAARSSDGQTFSHIATLG